MAKEKKVEQITDMEVDFAQWYTDICRKAELVEYASVKGFTILRPYGYAIWENIQSIMDAEFKKTGHVNVAMPVLIPESLLKKEGELVNGFAPEVAWVTMGGSEKLEERLAFRPTSETMFCDHWSRVLQTYRELPMLYNQWCSVIRWEKTTRPFLRSREFWWQEGHTIHETAEEAKAETEQQLNCYADFFENVLAIPVVRDRLAAAGIRVKMDDSDNSMGWKCAQYEMKGVPVRVELGPRDIEAGQCVLVRRNDGEKTVVKLEELEAAVKEQLELVQKGMYEKALKNMQENTYEAHSLEEAKQLQAEHGGFIKTMWCGELECELKMKEEGGMSSRCMPLQQECLDDKCAICGKPAKHSIYWGIAY